MKSDIFKSSNKLFYILYIYIYIYIFFLCIYTSKNLSDNFYQENKERLRKKLVKDIKTFLRKKGEKTDNIVVSNTKSYQKMRNKNLLSIEKTL